MPPTPDSGPPSGSKADSQIAYSAEEALAMDRWLIEERGFTLEGLMAEAGLRLARPSWSFVRRIG